MMAEIIDIRRRRKRRISARDFRPVLARQAAMARRDPLAVAFAAIPEPLAGTARVSEINPIYPVYGTPTTVTVRNNFAAAKREIEELQDEKLDLAGGMMTGPIWFAPGQIVDGGTL
jgi:hypothetical protein